MLVAYDRRGKPVHAHEAVRGSAYRCGYCHTLVILHQGLIRIPHYAHHPGNSDCPGAAPESAEHMEMKRHLYDWLLDMPGVKVCRIEHRLGGPDAQRRADVWAQTTAGNIAFECQVSPLTVGDLRAKLSYPADTRIYWCMIVHHSVLDLNNHKLIDLAAEQVRIPAWIHELHTLYAGRVYIYETRQIYPLRLAPVPSRTTLMTADVDYPIIKLGIRCEHTADGFALAWFQELSLAQQLDKARRELTQAEAQLRQRRTEPPGVLRSVLVATAQQEVARARHRVNRLERAYVQSLASESEFNPPLVPSVNKSDVQSSVPAAIDETAKQQDQPPLLGVPTSSIAKGPNKAAKQKGRNKAAKQAAATVKPKAAPKVKPSSSREQSARHAFHDALQQEIWLEKRCIQMQQRQTSDSQESKEICNRLTKARGQSDAALKRWCAVVGRPSLVIDPLAWCTKFNQVRERYKAIWAVLCSLQEKNGDLSTYRYQIEEAHRTEENARIDLENMLRLLKTK